VVNAALSYGYAVLLGEAISALAAAGLDPAAGFLHADDGNRPSLALDLMEEFRPLIVDATVCELFRRGSLARRHGRVEADRGGVWLTEKGRRALVSGLEDRLLTIAYHVPSGTKTSYRRAIHLQAAQIASDIEAGDVRYRPVTWR
jgi:CRISPR-associated protein Cas1